MPLPSIALSIRQPWAWAIIFAGKDIENRGAFADRFLTYRGHFCVHASLGMTQDEYADGHDFMASIGIICPPPAQLVRGGVIGTARVVELVSEHHSKWYFGPRGLVLADAKPSLFVPCAGALGFFEVKETPDRLPAEPARWMLPKDVPILTQARLL